MPRPVGLRPHHPRQPLRVERLDDTIVEHTSRMHDRTQRPIVRNRREHCLQLPTIRDVTRPHRDRTAQTIKLGSQLASALRIQPRTADQQQALNTMLDHQMPSNQCPQAASPAGHQNGPRAEASARHILGRGCRRLDQPRSQQPAAAQGHLRLVARDRRPQGVPGRCFVVEVDESKRAGVLGLRRADESPQRRGGEIGGRLAPRGDGSARDQDQSRVREPLARDPRLHQRQRGGHGGVRGAGRSRVHPPNLDRREHDLRRSGALLERGDERRGIGMALGVEALDTQIAEQRDGRDPVLAARRRLDPLEGVEAVASLPSLRAQCGQVDRTNGDPVRGQDEFAVAIGDGNGDRLVADRCNRHAQRGRTGGEHARSRPGERQRQTLAGVASGKGTV
jgi:hypothetical protein